MDNKEKCFKPDNIYAKHFQWKGGGGLEMVFHKLASGNIDNRTCQQNDYGMHLHGSWGVDGTFNRSGNMESRCYLYIIKVGKVVATQRV